MPRKPKTNKASYATGERPIDMLDAIKTPTHPEQYRFWDRLSPNDELPEKE